MRLHYSPPHRLEKDVDIPLAADLASDLPTKPTAAPGPTADPAAPSSALAANPEADRAASSSALAAQASVVASTMSSPTSVVAPTMVPPLPTPSPTTLQPLPHPLSYEDLYVDDFYNLVQGNRKRRHMARRILLHAIDDILWPLDPAQSHIHKEPASVKKLRKEEEKKRLKITKQPEKLFWVRSNLSSDCLK
jgi:hypothetical protein